MPDTPDLIMELNDFANHCGYVFNACMQDGIIANNGYNCSHPDQDETVEDDSGESVGCCHCWSCPLGYPPNAKDLVDCGILSEEDAVQTTSMNSLASIFRQWTTSSCRTRIPSGDCGRPG